MKDFSRYCSIPFKDKGRDWSGCDCWGLVKLFCKNELGIDLDSHDRAYSGVSDIDSIMKIADEEKKKWTAVSPPGRVGDVVEIGLFRRDYHVGVVAAQDYILHIETSGFAQLIPAKSFRIARRIKGCWRYNGIPC